MASVDDAVDDGGAGEDEDEADEADVAWLLLCSDVHPPIRAAGDDDEKWDDDCSADADAACFVCLRPSRGLLRGTVDTSSLASTAPDAAVDDCDADPQHSEASRLDRHPPAGCLGDAGRSGVSALCLALAFGFGAAFAGVDFCGAGSDGLDGANADDDKGAGEGEEDEDEAGSAGESDITSAGGRRPSLPAAAARCAFKGRPAPSDIGRDCGRGKRRGAERWTVRRDSASRERCKSETTHAALADRLARQCKTGPWIVRRNECNATVHVQNCRSASMQPARR